MLNDRLSAARKVMAELRSTEGEIENAILHNARLISAIVEGRLANRVPLGVGQAALVELAAVAAHLVDARGRVVVAHAALAQDKIDVGLATVGMGDLIECRPSGDARSLQVVA